MKTANFTTVEFQIPRQVINNVIGKNGSHIKQVEFTSGTRISFRQSGGEKICVIRGTVEACYFAKSIIKEFIGMIFINTILGLSLLVRNILH